MYNDEETFDDWRVLIFYTKRINGKKKGSVMQTYERDVEITV